MVLRAKTERGRWPQILVYAEGVNTNGSALVKFKTGAFEPGVPVQPVLVKYPNKYATTTWSWAGTNAIQTFIWTISQFHVYQELQFLPVYQPSEAEKNDPNLYAENVRKIMAKAAGLPLSDATLDDMIKAR